MRNGVRKILIGVVVVLLIGLFAFIGTNVFKDKDVNEGKKVDNKKTYELKELVSVKDNHCDSGYCISDYSYTQIEDGTFELKFNLVNNNELPLNKGCFKLYYSDEDFYISCYEIIESGETVSNIVNIKEDYYSKYSDYKVMLLTGDELNKYYSDFEKNLVMERESK